MHNATPKAMAALVFTILVWGVTTVFVRGFSLAVGPLDALVIRVVLVTIVFTVILAATTGFAVAWRDWPRLLAVSLIGMLGYFLGTVFGFAYAPAGIGTLIMSTQPLLIALLASRAGSDTLTRTTIMGLLVALAGSVLLVWDDDLGGGTTASAEIVYGCFLIFLAGVAWAFYVVYSKPLITRYGALKITGLSNILIVFPILPWAEQDMLTTLQTLPPDAFRALLFLTFVAATTSVVAWNYAAGILRPSLLGSALYMVPLLAVAAGWAMLDEPVTMHIIIAGTIILLGVAIAQIDAGALSGPRIGARALAFFAIIAFGLVPVALRYLLRDMSPETALVLNLYPSGLIAAGIAVWLGPHRIPARDWLRLVTAALVGFLASHALAVYGIAELPAAWSGIVLGLEPVLLALAMVTAGNGRADGWFILALVASLAGGAVLMFAALMGETSGVTRGGITLVALSAVAAALFAVLIRPVADRHGPAMTYCLVLAISAAPLSLLASPGLFAEAASLTAPQALSLLFLGGIATLLAPFAWLAALARLRAAETRLLLLGVPVVAAGGAILLLDENFGPWLALGGALILTGAALSCLAGEDSEEDVADEVEALVDEEEYAT